MPINPDAVGSKGAPVRHAWDSKDCLLYALGVGAGAVAATGACLEGGACGAGDPVGRLMAGGGSSRAASGGDDKAPAGRPDHPDAGRVNAAIRAAWAITEIITARPRRRIGEMAETGCRAGCRAGWSKGRGGATGFRMNGPIRRTVFTIAARFLSSRAACRREFSAGRSVRYLRRKGN